MSAPRCYPGKKGWYRDTTRPGLLRHWNGTRWAHHYRTAPPWLSSVMLFVPSEREVAEGPAKPREPALLKELASRYGSLASSSKNDGPPDEPPSVQVFDDWNMPVRDSRSALRRASRRSLIVSCGFMLLIALMAMSVIMESRPTTGNGWTATNAAFISSASADCSVALPSVVDPLRAGSDGSAVTAASNKVDQLRSEIEALPSSGTRTALERWLTHWQVYVVSERGYGQLLSSTSHPDAATVSKASDYTKQASIAGLQANWFAIDNSLTACSLPIQTTPSKIG